MQTDRNRIRNSSRGRYADGGGGMPEGEPLHRRGAAAGGSPARESSSDRGKSAGRRDGRSGAKSRI